MGSVVERKYEFDLGVSSTGVSHISLDADSFSGGLAQPFETVFLYVERVIEDSGQAYYWTTAWQSAEAQSRRDYAEGNYHSFDDVTEALAWLDSEED